MNYTDINVPTVGPEDLEDSRRPQIDLRELAKTHTITGGPVITPYEPIDKDWMIVTDLTQEQIHAAMKRLTEGVTFTPVRGDITYNAAAFRNLNDRYIHINGYEFTDEDIDKRIKVIERFENVHLKTDNELQIVYRFGRLIDWPHVTFDMKGNERFGIEFDDGERYRILKNRDLMFQFVESVDE